MSNASESNDYGDFRHDLDAVLAGRDPQALRAFLIERGQWPADTTMDPEAAMWMMIAASPALPNLHGEARAWLAQHGRGSEADAITGRTGSSPAPRNRPHKPRRPHQR
jgi:hypothetical protein